MSTIQNWLRNAWQAMSFVGQILRYAAAFLVALVQPKAAMAAKLLAVQSQLAVCKHRIKQKKDPRPRFTSGFRLLWVVLSRCLDRWHDYAYLMQPATVKKWHTTGYRLYWRWKSKPGRPTVSREMQGLIRQLSGENPLWSAERIRDTLLLLHYKDVPCADTIRKYMIKPEGPHKPSTTWLPFLRNQLDVSWAMDFFTVPTLNFKTLYVFVVLNHGRRRVVHWAVTQHPCMDWVVQQLREAMPFGERPRFLLRDNDGTYSHAVPASLNRCGIHQVRTAYRCPWQNPYVERFIGTLRRELLDHIIVFGQSHVERLLAEYIDAYYHVSRPHQGLAGDTPVRQQEREPVVGPTKLMSIPVLGGLHHRYVRVAA